MTMIPKEREGDALLMPMYEVMNGWMSGWMLVTSALFLVVLLVGVLALIRGAATSTSRDADVPLGIAGLRLARGEITKDEFEQIRAALGR
jgi:uncharacterized membrane protein